MTREIMIVGAGGFGREIAWTIERINDVNPVWELLGFADDAPGLATGTLEGYPLLGPVAQASRAHPGAAVCIAIGDNAVRERIYRRMRGHDFPVVIDPSADVATSKSKSDSASAPRKVITLWMINMSDAVRVTPHRTFIIGPSSAHQVAIIADAILNLFLQRYK